MPNYDFSTLSPLDFEILVRDLLQSELRVRFESFRSGRDRGIDLRYSINRNDSIIIQCKNYAYSTFSVLLNHLKKEVIKVKELKPKKYILATSVGMTPKNKEDILELFDGYILDSKDIYSREELNNLLVKYPNIEQNNFKLWFTSLPVLENLLHSSIINASRDEIIKIQKHAKYFVKNKSFDETLTILGKYNYCIIAGNPGIGKTILAEMLILYFINKGYEVLKITEDISEAQRLNYEGKKRLFYYDDFLGQTTITEKFNKNEDQRLIDFFQSIKESKTSKLILTTREYILNQAKMLYEKIDLHEFKENRCIIALDKYTRFMRANILFNHLYFSDIPANYCEAILKDRKYLTIIDHSNYSPRIIELMTEYIRIKEITPARYAEVFISNLANPIKIWSHAFERQLSQASRNLLYVISTVSGKITVDDLKEAFHLYNKYYAIEFGVRISPTDFINALKELEGNFIRSSKIDEKIIIEFHNPSVKDFILSKLTKDRIVATLLLKSVMYYEQIKWIWNYKQNIDEDSHFIFREIITKNYPVYLERVKHVMNSNNCELITYWNSGLTRINHVNTPLEEKINFFVESLKIYTTNDSLEILTELLKLVSDRVANEIGMIDELTKLIKNLKLINIPKGIWTGLINNIKIMILKSTDDLFLYNDILSFVDDNPEVITPNDFAKVKNDFKVVVMELPMSDDPDIVKSQSLQIWKISRLLQINDDEIENKIAELDEHAEELEEHMPNDDEDEYDPFPNTDYCSDNDIESLFNILK